MSPESCSRAAKQQQQRYLRSAEILDCVQKGRISVCAATTLTSNKRSLSRSGSVPQQLSSSAFFTVPKLWNVCLHPAPFSHFPKMSLGDQFYVVEMKDYFYVVKVNHYVVQIYVKSFRVYVRLWS